MTKQQQIVLTRGIPASGKTTFARNWVAEDPDWRVRNNRDDIRMMVTNKFHGLSRHQEETVTLFQLAMARTSIGAKLSVIVDDTNLRASTVRTWMELADELGAEFVVEDIAVDVEEAVARDKARDRQVGEEVIRDFHKRFIQKGRFPALPERQEKGMKGKAYVPNPDLPKAYLVDIDGTIADMKICGRGPFEWHRVEEDAPVPAVIDVVRDLRAAGSKIVLMSGRDSAAREGTVRWLKQHGIEYDDLFMRPAGDQRRDSVIKEELFYAHVAPKYFVQAAIDDRQQVVDHYRQVMGIPVFQCDYGDF